MDKEQLRMQMLAGIITESQYKAKSKHGFTYFKDISIGEKFLRFGENGQLWEKTSDKEAKFIKNMGKKLSKYHLKYGVVDVFPKTMEVTPYQNEK